MSCVFLVQEWEKKRFVDFMMPFIDHFGVKERQGLQPTLTMKRTPHKRYQKQKELHATLPLVSNWGQKN
jgi:hypothetical protein